MSMPSPHQRIINGKLTMEATVSVWSNLSGANGTNYTLSTSTLAVGNYEFQVIVTNSTLNVTSSPVTLTVLAPSAYPSFCKTSRLYPLLLM